MFIVLPALLQAAALASAPLQPNGSWTVAYEENMCVAARKYGAKGDVVVGFRPGPLGDRLEISIDAKRWPGRLLLNGRARVSIAPRDRQFDASYAAFGMSRRSPHAMTVNTTNAVLSDLEEGSVLTVDAQPSGSLALRMTNMAKLSAALADCRNVLLKHWGVDLAAIAKIATPAKPIGDVASWIGLSDYPKAAVRKGERGTSNILWTIGPDGAVGNCRVVGSSGLPELDNAACSAILRRARYEPARDALENPIMSWQNRRIVWRAFRL